MKNDRFSRSLELTFWQSTNITISVRDVERDNASNKIIKEDKRKISLREFFGTRKHCPLSTMDFISLNAVWCTPYGSLFLRERVPRVPRRVDNSSIKLKTAELIVPWLYYSLDLRRRESRKRELYIRM